MATHSIDYLNARRDSKPASGGTRYIVKRNAVNDRAQLASLDIWEETMLQIAILQADFRSDMANRRHVEAIMQGETSDDWF
jgi:hypothetical protein